MDNRCVTAVEVAQMQRQGDAVLRAHMARLTTGLRPALEAYAIFTTYWLYHQAMRKALGDDEALNGQ